VKVPALASVWSLVCSFVFVVDRDVERLLVSPLDQDFGNLPFRRAYLADSDPEQGGRNLSCKGRVYASEQGSRLFLQVAPALAGKLRRWHLLAASAGVRRPAERLKCRSSLNGRRGRVPSIVVVGFTRPMLRLSLLGLEETLPRRSLATHRRLGKGLKCR
jgi:hypothetical protein